MDFNIKQITENIYHAMTLPLAFLSPSIQSSSGILSFNALCINCINNALTGMGCTFSFLAMTGHQLIQAFFLYTAFVPLQFAKARNHLVPIVTGYRLALFVIFMSIYAFTSRFKINSICTPLLSLLSKILDFNRNRFS